MAHLTVTPGIALEVARTVFDEAAKKQDPTAVTIAVGPQLAAAEAVSFDLIPVSVDELEVHLFTKSGSLRIAFTTTDAALRALQLLFG
jgi:hypothetical protein